MSEKIIIPAELKESAGKGHSRRTRAAGRIPAVLYGGSTEPAMLSLDPRDIMRRLRRGKFYATLISLEIDGKLQQVLPRAVQFHKVSDAPVHVDFMRVEKETKLTVKIPVVFTNEEASPGLKRGAVLNIVRGSIEVKCTAANMPQSFTVDLTGKDVNDSVKVSAIDLGEGVVTTIKDRDFVIATVVAPSALKRQMADDAKGGGSDEEAAE